MLYLGKVNGYHDLIRSISLLRNRKIRLCSLVLGLLGNWIPKYISGLFFHFLFFCRNKVSRLFIHIFKGFLWSFLDPVCFNIFDIKTTETRHINVSNCKSNAVHVIYANPFFSSLKKQKQMHLNNCGSRYLSSIYYVR